MTFLYAAIAIGLVIAALRDGRLKRHGRASIWLLLGMLAAWQAWALSAAVPIEIHEVRSEDKG